MFYEVVLPLGTAQNALDSIFGLGQHSHINAILSLERRSMPLGTVPLME